MEFSVLVNCRKRRRSLLTENSGADRRNDGLRFSSDKLTGFEGDDVCKVSEACRCLCCAAVSEKQRDERFGDFDEAGSNVNRESFPLACIADQANSEGSSTGSSCYSPLPSHENSHTQQQMLMDCRPGCEAESESWSCCGSTRGEEDIAAFLHEDAIRDDDEAVNEAFSFNPETVFVNNAGLAESNLVEDAPFIGSSVENGSWFFNELDSKGQHFLNEVLDQEWMAAAVANLDKVHDVITSDSCILHLPESENAGKLFPLSFS